MTRAERKAQDNRYRKWHGAYKPYDLVKEATMAVVLVLGIVLVLSVLFSSPDDKPITMKSWSHAAPLDFATIATQELDGDSGTATYGPPYNHAADGQHIAFIYPAKWLGVSHPIDTAQDFVIQPLKAMVDNPTVEAALNAWHAASPSQQAAWGAAYEKALTKASVNPNGTINVPAGNYGPESTMIMAELALAQSGGLDGALLTSKQFFQTDYTKILMFLQDDNEAGAAAGGNGYFANVAASQHLLGSPQWGMMNETGSFPGQVWLWLYTFWYQVSPFSWSANADLLVMAVMTVLSLALILIPFIPGLRDLPRLVPIYKLIWRDHYRSLRS